MPEIRNHHESFNSTSTNRQIFSLRTKILLFTGLFLLLFAGFYYLHQTIQLTYFVPEVPEVTKNKITPNPPPVEISLPTVNVTLPVSETTITNNVWSIAKDSVSHLNVSANPEDPGPIIMYAHNTNSLFGPIRSMKPGDEIIVTTTDNKIHRYTVTNAIQTDPDELSVFFDRDYEALYLFTCDGFMDLKRYVIIAEPVTALVQSPTQINQSVFAIIH